MSGEDYKVGKNRPPLHSRFKPGVCPNPRGRPKGRRNFSTAVLAAMREPIAITEHGRRRTVSKFEAAMKQLANKMAGGDMKAIQVGSALVQLAEQAVDPAAARLTPEQRRALDLQIMEVLAERREAPEDDDDASS